MRTNAFLTALVLIMTIIGITACEKTLDQTNGGLEGTYVGAFSTSTLIKSALQDGTVSYEGRADVRMMENASMYYLIFHGVKQ
jgi:hypothetical protein